MLLLTSAPRPAVGPELLESIDEALLVSRDLVALDDQLGLLAEELLDQVVAIRSARSYPQFRVRSGR